MISALLANGIVWGLSTYFFRPSEVPVVLRSNVYLGYDLSSLSDWRHPYGVPAIAILFFVINSFVSFLFFRQPDRFAAYCILFGGLLVQCAALIAIISIVLANT
jgi:hypothetical protein